MKTTFKILTALLLSCSLTFISCSDDGPEPIEPGKENPGNGTDEPEKKDPYLKLSTESLTFKVGEWGQENRQRVDVDTNADAFRPVSDKEWAVVQQSGDGFYVYLTEENPDEQIRTATITVTSSDDDVKTVTVTQEFGVDESDYEIYVKSNNIEFDYYENLTKTLDITSDSKEIIVAYDQSIEWIETAKVENGVLTVTVVKNPSLTKQDRSTTLTLTAEKAEKPVTIEIHQDAHDMAGTYSMLYYDFIDEDDIVVLDMEFEYSADMTYLIAKGYTYNEYVAPDQADYRYRLYIDDEQNKLYFTHMNHVGSRQMSSYTLQCYEVVQFMTDMFEVRAPLSGHDMYLNLSDDMKEITTAPYTYEDVEYPWVSIGFGEAMGGLVARELLYNLELSKK